MRTVLVVGFLLGSLILCASPAFADQCKGLQIDEGAQSKVEVLVQEVKTILEKGEGLDVLVAREEVRGKLLPLGRLAGTLRASGYTELAVAGKHLKAGHRLLKEATKIEDFSAAISEINTGLSLLQSACPTLP